jgi:hypothetical protein
MVTDLVRKGDVLLRLRRFPEAEAAYSAALSKSDPDAAKKHEDFPALAPIAAAHAGIADLHLSAASTARDSAERDRLRAQACEAYRQAGELNKLIPAAWTFNPSNFPAVHRKTPDSPQVCDTLSAR